MAECALYPVEQCLESEVTMSKKFAVSINKNVYTMASTDGQSAEITMYGDIYEQRPVDYWTNKPIEGTFILLDEFLSDLDQIAGCKEITIRMNSYGGDAGVSNTIHNRLRELARDGAHLTCIVDGVAMSGGSLIMCACDNIKVNPSSMIMIHKCWTCLFGGYNADELRDQAVQQDAWDKMQIAIYKRKTGLSDTILSHMMSETTYMTGKEAVEKGFADELLEDAEPVAISASADGRCLFVAGRQMHLAPGMFAPDSIPTVTPEASATVDANKKPEFSGEENEGGNTPMTKEELKAQNPDLYSQVKADGHAEAVQAEQKRLQEIDEVADLFDDALVAEAKYGPKACSAQELTYRAAQKAAKQGKNFLTSLDADAEDGNTGEVGSAPAPDDEDDNATETPEAKLNKARAAVKTLFRKKEDN